MILLAAFAAFIVSAAAVGWLAARGPGTWLVDHSNQRSLPSNGIVDRFHHTLPDGHFRAERPRAWFETIDEMRAVPDNPGATPHRSLCFEGESRI